MVSSCIQHLMLFFSFFETEVIVRFPPCEYNSQAREIHCGC